VTTATRLELHHPDRSVGVKEQITLRAVAYNAAGWLVAVPDLIWSSSDVSIATVDSQGAVTGHSLGVANIKAAGGGLEATVTVSVRAARLRLALDSKDAALVVGDTAVLTATMLDGEGLEIPAEFSVRWDSDDVQDAVFRGHRGLTGSQIAVIGVSTGLAVVTAETDNLRAALVIAVVPERTSDESALLVAEFYFREYPRLGDVFVYSPAMHVSVAPGSSVELVRVEVAVAGLPRSSFPPLCTNTRLYTGQHGILGTYGYFSDLLASSRVRLDGAEGVALLTYRADDGRVRVIAVRGSIAPWDYGPLVSTQFPWQPCS
jgi:hypothetical protein